MEYYRVLDNLEKPNKRWFLADVNFDSPFDFWKYVRAGEVDPPKKRLFVTVRKSGDPIDFTMADFGLLIVSEKVKKLLNGEDVQLLPVKISGLEDLGDYYIIVTKCEFDCVDENKSVFDKWAQDDPIRPDKAGHYKTIYKLFVDEKKISGSEIFRVKNYNVAVLVNEDLKARMEALGITGIEFSKVS